MKKIVIASIAIIIIAIIIVALSIEKPRTNSTFQLPSSVAPINNMTLPTHTLPKHFDLSLDEHMKFKT